MAAILGIAVCCAAMSAGASPPLPKVVRIFPLGGQAGSTVAVEILGDGLANTTTVEFDCRDLTWTRTIEASTARLKGEIRIAPGAGLGPHMFRPVTRDGFSTSAMFNVEQFASIVEREPDDELGQAQTIESLPVSIHGLLDGAPDRDIFALRVKRGERKLFDLRAIESGSAVEARMFLLDERGRRVSFNDDRDDVNENPLIEHTFDQDGTYYVKLDQYRGPRGFNFGKSCAYILRISGLPRVEYTSPLGLRAGRATRLRLFGSGLDSVRAVYLTATRRAEYSRMTYPYTMPIHFGPDPDAASQVARLTGKLIGHGQSLLEAEFSVPADVAPGLWRVWTAGTDGIGDGPALEISNGAEIGEAEAAKAEWGQSDLVVNGALGAPGEKDVFRFRGVAGRPIRFWTLASQLGVPRLDTVLQLRDGSGKKLAENDDVVAGQGTLLGNPDSSLFYTPKEDGVLLLTVSDRVDRGGPDFQYRLKISGERPGFQLFTTPENATGVQGGTGNIKVHLIREAGFEGEVSVWFENVPPDVEAPRGKFRADQLFEPNADGADMIIPEIEFALPIPAPLPAGTYPIRIFGVATAEESSPNRRVVEAHATVLMGPLLDLWNFIRRPAPEIALTVVAPLDARLVSESRTLKVPAGDSASLNVKTEQVPENAQLRVANLPPGLTWRVTERHAGKLTLTVQAEPEAAPGSFDISVEGLIGDRWVSTGVIALSVQKPVAGTPAQE